MLNCAGVVWRADFSASPHDPYEWLAERSLPDSEAFHKGEPGLPRGVLEYSGVMARLLDAGPCNLSDIEDAIQRFLANRALDELKEKRIESFLDTGIIVGKRLLFSVIGFSTPIVEVCAKLGIGLAVSCYFGSGQSVGKKREK